MWSVAPAPVAKRNVSSTTPPVTVRSPSAQENTAPVGSNVVCCTEFPAWAGAALITGAAVMTEPAAAVGRRPVEICIPGLLPWALAGRRDRCRSVVEGVPDEAGQAGLSGDVRMPVVVGGELRQPNRLTERGSAVGRALRVLR